MSTIDGTTSNRNSLSQLLDIWSNILKEYLDVSFTL